MWHRFHHSADLSILTLIPLSIQLHNNMPVKLLRASVVGDLHGAPASWSLASSWTSYNCLRHLGSEPSNDHSLSHILSISLSPCFSLCLHHSASLYILNKSLKHRVYQKWNVFVQKNTLHAKFFIIPYSPFCVNHLC